ncbi:MAG: hypothetical protein IPJ40_23840 [Saprospirales bacterium]|nr:hypothetical protein [Saprospirales bacterium]
MRPSNIIKGFFAFILVLGSLSIFAQQPTINYFRPWDKSGLNVFESPKSEITPFEGVKVRIGGNFTQQYQSLSHESEAPFKAAASDSTKNLNELFPLGPGFNLAAANLNLDVQLGDGIRVALENYMSSRHHSEFWVKGGYIQIDKLPFFGNPEFWTKYMTAKIGHFEVNYGDAHFRRTDNGNSFFNPFVGNNIMDAFATEIGAELYFKHPSGFMLMVGLTDGLINGDVKSYEGQAYTKGPSILAKVAFDRTFGDDFRLRLSGSFYNNKNTIRNTLYGGDRTGARYFMPMELNYTFDNKGNITGNTVYGTQAFGPRLNPGFNNEITALMFNALVKFKGLELFGTYETASGLKSGETAARTFGQFNVDLLYRFLKDEQLFVGVRYNSASGDLTTSLTGVTVNRFAGTIGWYVTKNLLAKVEYVNQTYVDFPSTDYRYNGKFNGIMVEAAVAF